MKKQILLITLLMALFAPLAMNAQSRSTLTVYGDNTTTNEYVPIYGFWADSKSKCEFIIPKEKLSAMTGGRISAMKFYLSSSGTSNQISATFNVFVKEVSATTLTGFTGTDNATTVFNNTITIATSASNVEFDIPFSSDYVYNGGNLLVGFYQTGNTSYNHTYWTGETQSTNTAWSGYGSDSGSAQKFLPKTTFTYVASSTPYISLNPNTATVITGSTQTLTATYGNVSGTPTITYSSSNTSVATVSGSGTTATVTAVAPGTATITATMNGSYTATCTITVEDPSYCTPMPTSVDNNGISNVSFGTGDHIVNNTTTMGNLVTYLDCTDQIGAVEAGVAASVNITYKTGYTYGTAIWVDLNKNYEFESNEVLYYGTSANSNPTTLEASITIPATIVAGDYRMRIGGADQAFDNQANLNPCYTGTYACFQDYTLRVNAAPTCPKPTNLNVTNLMSISATLNWEGNAESYNVQYRKAQSIDPTAGFFDDFENGLGNWTLIVNAEGTGWQTFDATQFTDGSNYSGNYVAMARSYENGEDITADNWMITSKFTSIPNTMTYWAKNDGRTDHQYDETYDVCVSTGTNNTSDFVIVQTFTTTPYEWEQITIDLSAYAGLEGYIAFHHHDAEKDMLLIDDVFIGSVNIIPAGEWIESTTTNNFIDITGLVEDADYEWQVQADCGEDGESDWTNIATFHTPSACDVTPTALTAEVTGNAAELSWIGATDTYNLQYREADPTAPATIILNVPTDIWNDGSGYQMLLDADATAYGDVFTATGGWTATDYSAFEYLIPTEAECSADATHIVIENSVSIQIPAGTYDWCIVNPSPGDKIYIAASNGNVGGRQDDYVFEPGLTYEFTPSIYGTNDGIDVTITDNNVWTLVEGVNNPYTLANLSPETTYQYKVQGVNCDGNGGTTDWSASASFTTPEFYTKDIKAYTTNGGYYLIASPLASDVTPGNVTNMISNTYDLYRFNQSNSDTEWENYKKSHFTTLENGKGYLYANSNNVTLVFTGAAYNGNGKIDLTQDASNTTRGNWNLVGNPFTEEANIGTTAFYKMKSDGTDVESVSGETIDAMEGIFVLYENGITSVTFAKGPATSNGKMLTLNVTQGRSNIDRAIVRFDEGNQLPKFQIFENTKVYIPQGTDDFAVVSAEAQGEMPVNFEATSNGTYTLSVNAENVEFSYLHLIDHMTGAEVDLLETPSYSFNATTSDYSSRFKLVFAQGNNSNSNEFAFISDGNIIVNGEGLLQVIDMTGRVISTSQVNGMSNIKLNAAAGVYVLKLKDKTQKIVVK